VNFEDASPEGFPRGLGSLLALDARTYVPGHGASGGREIVEEQKRYFDRVSASVAGGRASEWSEPEIVDELRRAFPGYRLEMVLPETVRRLSPPR
jgi:hypothetical protein